MVSVNSKDECLRNLGCTKNSYYLTIFGVSSLWNDILSNRKQPNIILPQDFYGSSDSLPIVDFITNIKTYGPQYGMTWQENLKLAVEDSAMSAVRNYYKETYEHVSSYCSESDQYQKFQAESWYRFSRLLRNSVTHDWKVKLLAYDIKKLNALGPITYKNISIDETIDGKSMYEAGITTKVIIDLCGEIRAFVENSLT